MKRAVALVAGTLVAGCSAFTDVDFLLNDPSATSTVPGPQKPAAPAEAKAERNSPQATLKAYANKPAPIPKRKPQRIVGIKPDKLVGMTRGEVKELIGFPVAVADRPPATVWSYRSGGCALDVFFYLDVGSKTFRALTYQVKGDKGADIAPTLCLGQIRAISYGS